MVDKRSLALAFILFLTILAFISIGFIEPIAQDSSYHNFADGREIYNISNFWNVVSNNPNC